MPGARSTTTPTGGCSAPCSTGRPGCSRAPPRLPAGPPSPEAVLVTCAYVVDSATPWVMQSLFLAAIGDAKDRGAKALEAFAYRYPEGESTYERFLVHRTVFPSDFLADFGFRTVRVAGAGRARAARARRADPGARGHAGAGLPGAEGGADAGARAAAALIEPGVPGGTPRSARSTSLLLVEVLQ